RPIQAASQRYTARKQLIALIAASVFNKIVTHIDTQRKRFAPEPGFLKPGAETLISAARNLYAKRKFLPVAGGNRIPALPPQCALNRKVVKIYPCRQDQSNTASAETAGKFKVVRALGLIQR